MQTGESIGQSASVRQSTHAPPARSQRDPRAQSLSRTQATQELVVVSQTLPPPQPPPARQVATHWCRVRSQVGVGAAQSSSVAHSTQAPVVGSQTLPPAHAAFTEQATQRLVVRSQRGVRPAQPSSPWQLAGASASGEASPATPASLFPALPPSSVPALPPVSPRTELVFEAEVPPQPVMKPTAHPTITQAARASRTRKAFTHPQKDQKQTLS